MENSPVRVRFAPSPTGGLHLGGVRTILYNYLFAKKNNGTFILRIEDTDQSRFVAGAEQYIFDCLEWCGLVPDESIHHGGAYGPYKQSERKSIYLEYAQQLIQQGHAYYAFDTPDELIDMREKFRSKENPTPQYDQKMRGEMRNSLTLPEAETKRLLDEGIPHVIRIKVPEHETIRFVDMIRGEIVHDAATVDDKVLIKTDGMPTYHLASVIDDRLMKISHIFRGAEWLPSAPVHILLWRYLGWETEMPKWVHLPLILKPNGNGKLSKRDGEKFGFPVFAMDWKDESGNVVAGFREIGFLPEAFINMLALLGWNPGSGQEVFTLKELSDLFSIDRIHKGGAKFDYEKAKWFNHQHVQRADDERLANLALPYFIKNDIYPEKERLIKVVGLIKERCHLLPDFVTQGSFFFKDPENIDEASLKTKWSLSKSQFFRKWIEQIDFEEASAATWEDSFETFMTAEGFKKKDVFLPLRVMLVGGKFGPHVFDITAFLGKEIVRRRIIKALELMTSYEGSSEDLL